MPRKGVVVSQERSHWRALFILAGVLRQRVLIAESFTGAASRDETAVDLVI